MRRKNYLRKLKNYESPFKDFFKQLNKIEVIEKDYFKKEKICFLGFKQPFESYEDGAIRIGHERYFYINPYGFLNLGVIAQSGAGKGRLMSNIIGDYHKQGFKIAIFCPKKDEWSSKRRKGDGMRLHPYSKHETLPIVNYIPGYVKHYLNENDFPLSTTYKYYSHKVKDFKKREVWKSLGMTDQASDFCISCLNRGITTIKEMLREVNKWEKAGNLAYASAQSIRSKISNIIGTNFVNSRLNDLDIKKEWENDNILVFNYFGQDGFMMSSDIAMVTDKIRAYAQSNIFMKKHEPILILFDDAHTYCDTSHNYNNITISTIKNCQNLYRSFFMNVIVAYQNPNLVAKEITEGSKDKILSYLENPQGISDVVPSDIVKIMKADVKNGGLVYDVDVFPPIKEWIYKPEGKNFYRFFPQDCRYGHDS